MMKIDIQRLLDVILDYYLIINRDVKIIKFVLKKLYQNFNKYFF